MVIFHSFLLVYQRVKGLGDDDFRLEMAVAPG